MLLKQYCRSKQHRHDRFQQHRLLHRNGELEAGTVDRLGVAEREDLPQPTGTLQHCAMRLLLTRWHAARDGWR